MTLCSNPECPKSKEWSGGKFRLIRGKWYCVDCAEWAGSGQTCKNLWDMVTTHLNGQPIHVKSLAHMRQLEKQFGVSNWAANNDQRNW
jgi:hypothetical protein